MQKRTGKATTPPAYLEPYDVAVASLTPTQQDGLRWAETYEPTEDEMQMLDELVEQGRLEDRERVADKELRLHEMKRGFIQPANGIPAGPFTNDVGLVADVHSARWCSEHYSRGKSLPRYGNGWWKKQLKGKAINAKEKPLRFKLADIRKVAGDHELIFTATG